jgi:hypothetical protein
MCGGEVMATLIAVICLLILWYKTAKHKEKTWKEIQRRRCDTCQANTKEVNNDQLDVIERDYVRVLNKIKDLVVAGEKGRAESTIIGFISTIEWRISTRSDHKTE